MFSSLFASLFSCKICIKVQLFSRTLLICYTFCILSCKTNLSHKRKAFPFCHLLYIKIVRNVCILMGLQMKSKLFRRGRRYATVISNLISIHTSGSNRILLFSQEKNVPYVIQFLCLMCYSTVQYCNSNVKHKVKCSITWPEIYGLLFEE